MAENAEHLSPQQMVDKLPTADTLRQLEAVPANAAENRMVAELAAQAGIPAPKVYEVSADNMPSPGAMAPVLQDGTPVILLDPVVFKEDPEHVAGIIGHELGHVHEAQELLQKGGITEYGRMMADIQNDESGALARSTEQSADQFAVKLGVGAQLRDALTTLDAAGSFDPNDKYHPPIEERVAAINNALCELKKPECPQSELDKAIAAAQDIKYLGTGISVAENTSPSIGGGAPQQTRDMLPPR